MRVRPSRVCPAAWRPCPRGVGETVSRQIANRLSVGWWTATLVTSLLIGGLSGCASSPVWSSLHSDTSVPDVWPLGSLSAAHWHTMETNAEASDFVIVRSEFVRHSPQLSEHGRRHVMEIAARLGNVPFPVLIEPAERTPQLDAARRDHVVWLLQQLGVDAAGRVVVSPPYSNGLNVD